MRNALSLNEALGFDLCGVLLRGLQKIKKPPLRMAQFQNSIFKDTCGPQPPSAASIGHLGLCGLHSWCNRLLISTIDAIVRRM